MRFDHAGIATDDAVALVDLYGGLFDAPVAHEETFGELSVTFLDLGSGYFELLEPTPDADGPIAGTSIGWFRHPPRRPQRRTTSRRHWTSLAKPTSPSSTKNHGRAPGATTWPSSTPRRPAACSSSTSSTDADRFDEGAASRVRQRRFSGRGSGVAPCHELLSSPASVRDSAKINRANLRGGGVRGRPVRPLRGVHRGARGRPRRVRGRRPRRCRRIWPIRTR